MKLSKYSILAIILIFMLVFTSCSPKKEAAKDSSEPATIESTKPEPSSEAAKTESAEPSMAQAEEAYSPEPIEPAPEAGGAVDAKVESSRESASDTVPTAPNTMGEPKPVPPQQPQAGVLTAGEWNDNDNFDFWLNLMQSNRNWNDFAKQWDLNVSRRIVVKVGNRNEPIANAKVELVADQNKVVWSAKTDNKGMAYLFNGIGTDPEGSLEYVQVEVNGEKQKKAIENPTVIMEFDFANQTAPERMLELSLVIDTTGSMGDELDYLKAELEGVVERISKDNANIPVCTGVTVYRDHGDEYVVRQQKLDDSIRATLKFLDKQYANGGGDWEEAVEEALDAAINDQKWNDKATARIILLVLDAPPHNTTKINQKVADLIEEAAKKGIVIIPIASSGIDKSTEYLLRSMAIATDGTYTFLTDDSGVGNSHIEPTIGKYQVEALDDLLVRVINGYLE